MNVGCSDGNNKRRLARSHIITTSFFALLAMLVGCGQSVETVERTSDQTKLAAIALTAKDSHVRRAAVARLADQDALAKVAIRDTDSRVRTAAVARLADQGLLAKVAMEGKRWDARRDAVARLTDQGLLAKLAMEATNSGVRGRAVARLTDQGLLAKVAMEGKERDVRRAAVARLTDQGVLAKLAVRDTDSLVRAAAVAGLTDQAMLAQMGMWVKPALTRQVTDQGLLARIAVEATDWDVRRAAVARLTDQTPLAKLALEATDWDVRAAVVAQLTDQDLLEKVAVEAKWLDVRVTAIGRVNDQMKLRQWAEKDPHAAIRQAAVTRIADDGFLAQRLRAESSAAVRAAIVKTLQKDDSLRGVALTAYHQKDREQALQRLSDRRSPAVGVVSTAHIALERRVEALDAETDSEALLALAVDGSVDALRAAAARRLSNPVAVTQAALRAGDREVLKILLEKLNDSSILNQIAEAAEDRPMRLAAARKAGIKPWREIFDAASAKGATVEILGDALGAVSLFSDVQREAVNGVQHASLRLIQRGDESRIPEMVDILEAYGDKILAEDYLNCGQPDLNAAALAWADRRGYTVGTGAYSHRATRGSGR